MCKPVLLSSRHTHRDTCKCFHIHTRPRRTIETQIPHAHTHTSVTKATIRHNVYRKGCVRDALMRIPSTDRRRDDHHLSHMLYIQSASSKSNREHAHTTHDIDRRVRLNGARNFGAERMCAKVASLLGWSPPLNSNRTCRNRFYDNLMWNGDSHTNAVH